MGLMNHFSKLYTYIPIIAILAIHYTHVKHHVQYLYNIYTPVKFNMRKIKIKKIVEFYVNTTVDVSLWVVPYGFYVSTGWPYIIISHATNLEPT